MTLDTASDATRTAIGYALWLLLLPLRALRWLWKQAVGFLMNAYAYVTDFAFDDVLPPSIRDLLNFAFGMIPQAFGLRGATPRQQINASAVLIGVTFLTGFLTAGISWVLILALWLPLLIIGIWRWAPAFNELWRRFRARLPVASDYDIPLWRSD